MRPYDPKVSLRGHESLPLQCPHFHFREKSRLVPVRFVQSHAFFFVAFCRLLCLAACLVRFSVYFYILLTECFFFISNNYISDWCDGCHKILILIQIIKTFKFVIVCKCMVYRPLNVF